MATYPSQYDPNSGFFSPDYVESIPDFVEKHPDTPQEPDDYTNGLAERVKASAPYQLAYAVFSQLTDKSWLNQLEMIPYSARNADPFAGEVFTQSDEERDDAAYQYCIEKIEQLYQSYRQYVQDLPLTQRQQFAAAGIYDASSINGAEVAPTGAPTANPSAVNLENPTLNILGRVSDAIFSANGGALSWFNALIGASTSAAKLAQGERSLELSARGLDQKDVSLALDEKRVNLAREQFNKAVESDKSSQALHYFDLAVQMLGQGYSELPSTPTFIADEVTSDDIARISADPAAKGSQNVAEIGNRTTAHQLAATPDITAESLEVMEKYNDYTFKIWQISLKRDAAIAERDRIVAEYESGLHTGITGDGRKEGELIAQYNQRITRYNSEMAEHQRAYITSLYKQGKTNKFARYAYGYAMTGYDFYGQIIKTQQTNAQTDYLSAKTKMLPFSFLPGVSLNGK